MRLRNGVLVTIAASVDIVLLIGFAGNLYASDDECARVAHFQTYSNAFLSAETGDVGGYELALQQRSGASIGAFLYVYEGVPNKDGISVSGRISGRKVTMEGKWIERLIEEPSHKEVIETHSVRIDGTLDSVWFRGTIKIEGLDAPAKIRLKRVDHIWMCK